MLLTCIKYHTVGFVFTLCTLEGILPAEAFSLRKISMNAGCHRWIYINVSWLAVGHPSSLFYSSTAFTVMLDFEQDHLLSEMSDSRSSCASWRFNTLTSFFNKDITFETQNLLVLNNLQLLYFLHIIQKKLHKKQGRLFNKRALMWPYIDVNGVNLWTKCN